MTGLVGGRALRCCLALSALVAFLTLSGCGSESESPRTTTLALRSAAVDADDVIRPSYRCGAGSLWLPLDWSRVPPETKELAIYIGRFKYVKVDGQRELVVPFADLVSQVDPSLRHLTANTIPEGATWSYFGPVSCPVARRGQRILLQVFALDRAQKERQMKKKLATRLTEEALEPDETQEYSRPQGKLTEDAAAIGTLITTYGPPTS